MSDDKRVAEIRAANKFAIPQTVPVYEAHIRDLLTALDATTARLKEAEAERDALAEPAPALKRARADAPAAGQIDLVQVFDGHKCNSVDLPSATSSRFGAPRYASIFNVVLAAIYNQNPTFL